MSAPGDSPKLSILICTLDYRESRFLKLMAVLLPQVLAVSQPVEVVALRNHGERTLFEYRQIMQDDARGEYLCCVDDDDMVAPYYAEEICKAIDDPATDVVGFEMDSTSVGCKRTYLSLRYLDAPWGAMDLEGKGELSYYRDFNHLTPVRASIARKGRWHMDGPPLPDDQLYRATVLPHLRSLPAVEVFIPRVMYWYQWSESDTNQYGGVFTPLATRRPLPWGGSHRPVIEHPCFRWLEL